MNKAVIRNVAERIVQIRAVCSQIAGPKRTFGAVHVARVLLSSPGGIMDVIPLKANVCAGLEGVCISEMVGFESVSHPLHANHAQQVNHRYTNIQVIFFF